MKEPRQKLVLISKTEDTDQSVVMLNPQNFRSTSIPFLVQLVPDVDQLLLSCNNFPRNQRQRCKGAYSRIMSKVEALRLKFTILFL